MECLEQQLESTPSVRPGADVRIMDGAVLVSILKPGGCKTFGDYTAKMFVPHIEREQNQTQRVDIVWDQYSDNSLESHARTHMQVIIALCPLIPRGLSTLYRCSLTTVAKDKPYHKKH